MPLRGAGDAQYHWRTAREVRMHANVGDRIIVHAAHIDEPSRDGEIIQVRGPHGAPPYVVRWSDTGHEGLYFPGPDSVVHHQGTDHSG